MFYLIIYIECVLSTRLCQQGADTADQLLHIAERFCCTNTWKQHPQLSSQGLRNTADNQVSCLPGEEHTRAASVLREMDVPRLLLHLFFKLSHTHKQHTSVLLFMLHYAVKTGCNCCFTSTPELIKHPQAQPPSGRFYCINVSHSEFLRERGAGFIWTKTLPFWGQGFRHPGGGKQSWEPRCSQPCCCLSAPPSALRLRGCPRSGWWVTGTHLGLPSW